MNKWLLICLIVLSMYAIQDIVFHILCAFSERKNK